MGRKCLVCDSANVSTINQRLRSGERVTDLASAFVLSEDSLARHKANHLKSLPESNAKATDLEGRLQLLWDKSEELLATATTERGRVDALQRMSMIADGLQKLQARPVVSTFEAMPLEEKIKAIRADGPLMRALLEGMVKDYDLGPNRFELVRKPGQRPDSLQ